VSKRLTLVASILASVVVFLDGSVVNVALPAIRDDLHAGLATQQWVVEAYLLTLGALILTGGVYADIHGRKRALMTGVTGFAITSLACAAAPTAEVLVAARALQGVAGALLVPASLALLTATFDDETERGAAVGTWTAWTGIAFVVGPLAGGSIIDAISWRGVFAVNLPIAAVTLWIAHRGAAESRDADAPPALDVPGAVMSVAFLGGAVLALIEQPDRGWGDPLVWMSLVVAVAGLVLFVRRELRCPHPMVPLHLFHNRNFSAVNAATLAIYGGLSAFTFFVVLFLQQVAGYSALGAGAALLPTTVVMFLFSRYSGALGMRIGPRLPMTAGPLVAAAGLLLMRGVDTDPSYVAEVLPGVLVFSVGLTLTVAPLTAAALSSVPRGHAGIASGVNNAVARVAGLIAIAVVGAIVAGRFGAVLDDRLPAAAADRARARPLVVELPDGVPAGQRESARAALLDASVSAFRAGITASALLVAAGGLISAAGVRNPRRQLSEASSPASESMQSVPTA
jgi:EmrB/QacA subfamily drug resistance transporter